MTADLALSQRSTRGTAVESGSRKKGELLNTTPPPRNDAVEDSKEATTGKGRKSTKELQRKREHPQKGEPKAVGKEISGMGARARPSRDGDGNQNADKARDVAGGGASGRPQAPAAGGRKQQTSTSEAARGEGKPYTLNPQPQTFNPKPYTLINKP